IPSTQQSEQLRALCHEHQAEMRNYQALLDNRSDAGPTLAYACTEPGCPVHYSIARGYFTLGQNGSGIEPDMVPKVQCPLDGMSMYLAETNREKRRFRLWRCPHSDGNPTNQHHLVRFPPPDIP